MFSLTENYELFFLITICLYLELVANVLRKWLELNLLNLYFIDHRVGENG